MPGANATVGGVDGATAAGSAVGAAFGSERCRGIRCVYLNNPVVRTDEFIRLLARKFGKGFWSQVPYTRVATWGREYETLRRYLEKNRKATEGPFL